MASSFTRLLPTTICLADPPPGPSPYTEVTERTEPLVSSGQQLTPSGHLSPGEIHLSGEGFSHHLNTWDQGWAPPAGRGEGEGYGEVMRGRPDNGRTQTPPPPPLPPSKSPLYTRPARQIPLSPCYYCCYLPVLLFYCIQAATRLDGALSPSGVALLWGRPTDTHTFRAQGRGWAFSL